MSDGWYQLSRLGAQVRPIEAYPGIETPDSARTYSQFKAPVGRTVATLATELRALDATRVVLELDLRERDIRLDGLPRADARPRTPRVVLSFESRYGPQRFATDSFRTWEENLRGIALSMEALRSVDRYGVSKRGEQYRGWRALPMTAGEYDLSEAITSRESAEAYLARWDGDARRALRETHPDMGGDEAEFRAVNKARELLGA
jgi:hypothetical protein